MGSPGRRGCVRALAGIRFRFGSGVVYLRGCSALAGLRCCVSFCTDLSKTLHGRLWGAKRIRTSQEICR